MATSVDAKLLRQTKFPPEFNRKVDMTKVNIEVMKKWIAGKISEILGNEDDVVIELCFNLLEGSRFPDIKSLQIQLTGFLDKDTAKFCKELWLLCLSAQDNPQGVPKELLEAKKLELIQEKIEADKKAEEARIQKERERVREREIEEIRRRERFDRGRGGRDGRGGREFDRHPMRNSRSPPRRRSPGRYREPPRREADSYVPPGSRRARRYSKSPSRSPSPSRSRSPSTSSSRSPPPRRRRYEDRHSRRDRRHRSASGSLSPDRRGHRRSKRHSPDYGDRDRSITRSDSSRSRTPRRDRRGQRPDKSTSPPRGDRRSRRYSSVSRSRSRSRSRDHGGMRGGRKEPSHNLRDTKDITADSGEARDSRRLSRSRDRDDHRRGRHHRSTSRSSKSKSDGSRSRSPRRDRKRRRSIERYAPTARRRRDSSVSAPDEKRQRADEDEGSVSHRPSTHKSTAAAKDADETTKTQPRVSSTELREKLLREKLVAMRRTISGEGR